ncbi:IS30 family transposase [Candidatus Poriferisocius sp.]|uniref:IS30 family transposase n=1 Tax=Candidatus Poriferisocius sp. TaxID=3101276 RepID=UPI003B01B6DC
MAQRSCAGERVRIETMVEMGVGAGEMARRLGRCRSTVWQELRRNGDGSTYRVDAAQAGAGVRALRPRVPRLAADRVLAGAVAGLLADRWSPHAISGHLRERGLRVCGETIYRACYDRDARSGLAADSWKLLVRQRRRRKPRSRCEQGKRSVLDDFRPIAQRPAMVATRAEAGHWEGDLMIGENNQSAVATLVEHTSRHTLVVLLPDGYDTHNTAKAVTAALSRQPAGMVKTLTWDQSTEMAKRADIEKTLNIQVYFCEPRSPRQRPTNEQNNATLRRWLPKGSNLNIGPVRLTTTEDLHAPQTPPLATSPNHLS